MTSKNKPVIVLVRPQLGQNIGKAARAMLNFGLTDMRLVAPRDGWPNSDAGPAASGADPVLEQAQVFASVEEAIADCSIVFASLAAWAQRDLKRMVAYLSINHLGYCMLGLFALAASPAVAAKIDTQAALSGVFMQIFNHGITAATLFYFVGLLEQRRGLRGIDDFGGLMQRTPLLCGWMSVAMFSSLGLPGLNGFVGEFLIFKGSFAMAAAFTAIAVVGLLVTAIVFMRAMQSLFSGPLAENCSAFPDLLRREKLIVVPVTLLMFAIGIVPQFMFNIFNTTVVQMARLLS